MKRSNFSRKVHGNLSNSKSIKLSILLEEKEEDLFDMPDEEEEEKESEPGGGEEELDASEEEQDLDLDVEDSEGGEEEAEGVSEQQFEDLADQIEAIKNTIQKTRQEDGTQSVESYISSAVSVESVSEGLSKFNRFLNENKSIKRFLFEEENVEKVEASLDDLDSILSKGTDLVNKFKKGKDVNINSYVDAAMNAFKNFDNLFSKELIVKQASINVLVLNSGGKAKQNVKEFEELFHKELQNQFGIEYEDHALDVKSYNSASGAKSQG